MDGSILLISDIHADIQALNEIIAIASSADFFKRYGSLKKIINLGDLLERGFYPREVVERLTELENLVSILGNHEEAFMFQRSISHPEPRSIIAHEEYHAARAYEGFFKGMPKTYVDPALLLYATHGGPIDQFSLITEDTDSEEIWRFSPTWQRISEKGMSYADPNGYRYLPEDAFAEVKDVFKRNGFIIVCGHDHKEIVYRQKDNLVDNVLAGLEAQVIDLNARCVTEKRLDIEEDSNYLIRIGIAGPEGYLSRGWADRSYFGVLEEKAGRRTVYLLSFDRQQRDDR